MIRKRSAAGFSAIELVIVLLVLGLLAGGLMLFMQKSSGSKNSSSQSPASTIKNFEDCKNAPGSVVRQSYPEVCVSKDGKNFTAPTRNAGPQTESLSKGYLVIKEWGVKVPLNEVTKDAYYFYQQFPDGSAVYVSSATLKDIDDNCAADKTSRVAIGRFVPDAVHESGSKMIELHSDAKRVGDYYYFAIGPQSICTENPKAQEIDTLFIKNIVQNVRNIEAE